jgi:hypothetical protein
MNQAQKFKMKLSEVMLDIAIATAQKSSCASQFTAAITREIARLIALAGGQFVPERKIELTRPTKRGPYQGRVDVFGVFPDSSVIAIEIDRGDKRWSLQKLIFAATKLHTQAVWIRWSGFVNLYVPPSVTLIDVTKVGQIIKTKRQLNRL